MVGEEVLSSAVGTLSSVVRWPWLQFADVYCCHNPGCMEQWVQRHKGHVDRCSMKPGASSVSALRWQWKIRRKELALMTRWCLELIEFFELSCEPWLAEPLVSSAVQMRKGSPGRNQRRKKKKKTPAGLPRECLSMGPTALLADCRNDAPPGNEWGCVDKIENRLTRLVSAAASLGPPVYSLSAPPIRNIHGLSITHHAGGRRSPPHEQNYPGPPDA